MFVRVDILDGQIANPIFSNIFVFLDEKEEKHVSCAVVRLNGHQQWRNAITGQVNFARYLVREQRRGMIVPCLTLLDPPSQEESFSFWEKIRGFFHV